MGNIRVTVTLPSNVVGEIDRLEPNRSRFVLGAIRRELARRHREELKRSLREPHPETSIASWQGLAEGWHGLHDEAGDLVDVRAGTPVRWTPGKGWTARKP